MGINAIDALGLIVTGCVIGGIGRLMFVEYRLRMFEKPRETVSVDDLFQVVSKMGKPGYLACTLMLCGVLFVLLGIAAFVFTITELIRLE